MNFTSLSLVCLPLIAGASAAPITIHSSPIQSTVTGAAGLAQALEEAEIMRRVIHGQIQSQIKITVPRLVTQNLALDPNSQSFWGSVYGAGGAQDDWWRALALPPSSSQNTNVNPGSGNPMSGSGQFGVTHSAAFYVPGQGALVTLDLKLPVRAVTAEEALNPAEVDEPDVWEQARRAMRSGELEDARTLLHAARRTNRRAALPTVIDPELEDQAMNIIGNVIARYGSKMDTLPDAEGIQVALRIFGGRGILTGAAYTPVHSLYGVNYGKQDGRPQASAILQIQKRDCDDFNSGRISLEAVLDRVRVTKY